MAALKSLLVAAVAAQCVSVSLGAALAPVRLRVEYIQNPRGVDVPYAPRLSWALAHTERGQRQTAYEIRVNEVRRELH